MPKIECLTPEQEDRLVEFREEWLRSGLSTEPSDRPKAERAITEMYKMIGKEPPEFRWYDSPLQCLNAIGEAGGTPGDKSKIRDYLTSAFYGQDENYWVAYYLFAHEIGVPYNEEDLRLLNLWADICTSTGWWWPFEGVCFMSERHDQVHMEPTPNNPAINRLHNFNGPALSFRDGYSLYRVHGVEVPRDVVEAPETLTATRVINEPNVEVRRVMLEVMGPRFWEQANAKVIDEDIDGGNQPRRLLAMDLPGDPDGIMLAVHVKCPSTGHETFLRVPPNTKTCREAVAWGFGMTVEEYQTLVEA